VHHRIGFVRPGYDADLVVWDSHPLSVGATPLQVYIDGKATLAGGIGGLRRTQNEVDRSREKPKMRAETAAPDIKGFCSRSHAESENIVITGISHSYLHSPHIKGSSGNNLTMVIRSGEITCLGPLEECMSIASDADMIALQDGYVLPGLTAISTSLGLTEIGSEDSTGDGTGNRDANPLDPDNAIYAKYGVHTEGKAFARARIGGVTRAITAPVGRSLLGGVSVGIKTSEKSNPLNGGIFKDEVALHFVVGQGVKGEHDVLK
jgi:imidazolonepropionase-like amidohydrolase